MKKIKIIMFGLLVMMMTACNLNSSGLSVTVKKTDERYEFKATYPDRKTPKVNDYLKKAFKNEDDTLFLQVEGGKEVVLANGTTFYIRSNPGIIELELLKKKNTSVGYHYFEELIEGIRDVLK
jgi:hypothetical protein